jgi:hypothetical protein
MERLNKHTIETSPALIVISPGTQDERIYLIKDIYFTSSGAWFRSDANPSRSTPIKVFFQLKYGPEQRTLTGKYYGKVVSSGPIGFAVEFECP